MTIAVTRPAGQAEPLCRLIEVHGGRALRFPTLAIVPAADVGPACALIDRLDTFQCVVFVSTNAVRYGLDLIRRRWNPLPETLDCLAVGQATARALADNGVTAWEPPGGGSGSESLLALPVLQAVDGVRILIVRGAGGRELLGETLRARGAEVHYAEVYRRTVPAIPTDELLQYGAEGTLAAIVVTSVESLQNLYTMIDPAGRSTLLATRLVVVSARLAQAARQLGFRQPPLLAQRAGDDAIIDALLTLPPHPLPPSLGTDHDGYPRTEG
jgi:uroporphyrinogen-III synthase